jgi:pyrroline-5-carboxylate reductase
MLQREQRAQRVVVIGSGVMGEALINGIVSQGIVSPNQVVATDALPEKRAQVAARYGVQVTHDNREAVYGADVVALAVKPQMMSRVLRDIKGRLQAGQLLLSIAAGTTLGQLVRETEHPAVIRAMPNTPGQIGQGITVWTATQEVDAAQRELAQAILGALGVELFVAEERYLDMATALSGSGPAYVFLFYEALVDAGVHIGFPRAQAEQLVYHTITGSMSYLKETGRHPAELRNLVTSPGGTTAEGLLQLEECGFRAAVVKGVIAAHNRASALGKS